MPFGGALTAGGLAFAGGLAGAFGKSANEYTKLDPASNYETGWTGYNSMEGTAGTSDFFGLKVPTINYTNVYHPGGRDAMMGQLTDMVNAGPGAQAITDSMGASNDYASMLKSFMNGGNVPTATDFDVAQKSFAPQWEQLNQNFLQQTTDANRTAAAMGRSPNDPILMAKLQTGMGQQRAMLGAQQGAYAMQQPGVRLGYAQQRASVLGGLASQAMQNRQMLLGMGEQFTNDDRNFRLNAAGHSVSSGGGFGGGLTGLIAGTGSGLASAGYMQEKNLFGMSGTSGSGFGGGYPSLGVNTNLGFGGFGSSF